MKKLVRDRRKVPKLEQELAGAVRRYVEQIAALKVRLLSGLENMPENNDCRTTSTHPHCGTVMFSALRENWTPFFHLFGMQKEKLAHIINTCEPQTLLGHLDKLVDKGVYVQDRYNRFTFHPDVRKFVCENLLGEEWCDAHNKMRVRCDYCRAGRLELQHAPGNVQETV